MIKAIKQFQITMILLTGEAKLRARERENDREGTSLFKTANYLYTNLSSNSIKRTDQVSSFIYVSFLALSSVTRWLHYWFIIWPLITTKMCAIANRKIAKSGLKLCQILNEP